MNLELMAGREPLAWLAGTEQMGRRASWDASDLLAARATWGAGELMDTPGRRAVLGSPETVEPRGTLADLDAEGPQGRAGPKAARVTRATVELQAAQA